MLSVIIPTYNRAQALPLALDSLVRQTLSQSEFEVLVVDDGSSDATRDVVERYQNLLPITYHHIEHRGVSVARNVGIERSRGEVIVFFDDDAVAIDEWLDRIKTIMGVEQTITGRVYPLTKNIWRLFAPHYDQGDSAHQSPVLLEGNCAIARAVFEEFGMFNEGLDYGHEGPEFIARIKSKYDVMYYPEVVIYHDYAKGLSHYLSKQKKFGDKMVFLKQDELTTLWDLLKNYHRYRQGDVDSGLSQYYVKLQKTFTEKILVALIARLGTMWHLWGAIQSWHKIKNRK